jgi:hypothetical protein
MIEGSLTVTDYFLMAAVMCWGASPLVTSIGSDIQRWRARRARCNGDDTKVLGSASHNKVSLSSPSL